MTDPVGSADRLRVPPPSGWGYPTVWLAVTLLALWLAACGGGSTEPVVTQPVPEQSAVDASAPGTASGRPVEDFFAIDRGTEEHLLFLQACLADLGFSVEINPLAGSIEGPSADQADAYDAAWWECKTRAEEAGLDRPFRPRTEDELRLSYAGLLLLQECLVENGYEAGPVPSEESFVDSGGQWHPFEALPFASVTNLPDNPPADLVAAMEASQKLRETCEESPNYWVRLARGDEG